MLGRDPRRDEHVVVFGRERRVRLGGRGRPQHASFGSCHFLNQAICSHVVDKGGILADAGRQRDLPQCDELERDEPDSGVDCPRR